MKDQAYTLRKMMHLENMPSIPVVTVGSGILKSGKSFFIETMATLWARKGKKVLIVRLGNQDSRHTIMPGVEVLTLNQDLFGMSHILSQKPQSIYERIKDHVDPFDLLLIEVNSEIEFILNSIISPNFFNIILLKNSWMKNRQNIECVRRYLNTYSEMRDLFFFVNGVTSGVKARELFRTVQCEFSDVKNLRLHYLGHMQKEKVLFNFKNKADSLLKLNMNTPFWRSSSFLFSRIEGELTQFSSRVSDRFMNEPTFIDPRMGLDNEPRKEV